MAMVDRFEMVDTLYACESAVDDLMEQKVIAVDAEGVNLGKEGPLTLLQAARLDGFVYLFNIYVEPRMFDKGGLKRVLESKDIVKMPYLPLHDELAAELGVVPSWLDLVKAGPRLAYNYLYGPAFPFYDRIWGPHPWSGARKAADEAMEHGYFAVQPRPCDPPQLPRQSKWIPRVMLLLALSTFVVIRYAKKDMSP